MKGDFFHILNRGVEQREIFYSDKDYLRFAHNLRDFNNLRLSLPYRIRRSGQVGQQVGQTLSDELRQETVDLFCWCLMPNHVHCFAQEKTKKGASLFSQKIFGGYTKYINEIRDRHGVLFQGRSKIILIERDEHFFHLPFYIMANPVSLIEPEWRERGIKNLERVINFLENYHWSSFPDLIGRNNFPETINKSLFYELFETTGERFRNDFIEWLRSYKLDTDFKKFTD
jgi:putative transposase